MGRTRAYVVLAVVLGVVLSPLVSGKDSFPHSTYPMFASTPGREATLQVAFGLDAEGTLIRLEPRTISGSVEVVHAYSTLLRANRTGDQQRLCEEIATRVATRGPEAVATVVVAAERHDMVTSVAEGPRPLARIEHARCPVLR
jgi:hypothetical protein